MSTRINLSDIFNTATAPCGAAAIMLSLEIIGESFVIEWGEVIPNEFTETYGSLAVALARLAALAECGEMGWTTNLAHDEGEFTEVAADWLNTVAP